GGLVGCETVDFGGVEEGQGSGLELDQAALGPFPQQLVDGLARDADDPADLLLGNGNAISRRPLRLALRKPQQRAREPGRHVEEKHFLHVLTRKPQAGTEELDEPHGDLRLAVHEGEEIPTIDHHQLAARERYGVGRARLTIEQRDLSEYLALAQHVENSLAAVDGRNGNFDRAFPDGEQGGAWIALDKNGVAGGHLPQRRECAELADAI